jgi:hypothetical protein
MTRLAFAVYFHPKKDSHGFIMASHMPANYAEDRLHRYLAHWTRDPNNVRTLDLDAISWATEEERNEREKKYCQIGSDYYDLVTPLYEQGWCVHSPHPSSSPVSDKHPGASSSTTRP